MDVFATIAVVVAIIGAWYGIKSKVKDDNLKDLKDRVAILENERQELKDLISKEREIAAEQHLQNQKAISNLEGQLATYKEIPLKSIATSLETLPRLVESNQFILDTLRGSAEITEKERSDGGLLVKTKPTNPLVVKPA